MVSVPINSDIITKGNSQVVLIPVRGMDSTKLQNSIKVPEGQKLVIINPQEILNTMELKKSHTNPAMVGITPQMAQTIVKNQQGVFIKSTSASQSVSGKKGLANIVPKKVPISQSVVLSPRASNPVAPQQRPQVCTVNKTAVPRLPSQACSRSTVRLQAIAKKVVSPSGQLERMQTVQQGVKQIPKTSVQNATIGDGGVTCTFQQPRHVTSTVARAVHPVDQVQSSNLQPPQTTSQTSLSICHTGLTSCQTSVATSQTGLVSQNNGTVNVYETLRRQFKESSSENKTNLSNMEQNELVTHSVKSIQHKQSNTHTTKNETVESNARFTTAPQVEDTSSIPIVSLTDSPSTSAQTNWLTDQEHENLLNDTVRRKRGRPRKYPSINTMSVGNNKKGEEKKHFSGPTLKHDLDKKGHLSGRAKNPKLNEHHVKTVKQKGASVANSWVCALCWKGSFSNFLGCLYGPYSEENDAELIESGGGELGEPQSKKLRGSSEDVKTELWFHGECMVWSPGVYALGESLVGYTQVVADAHTRVGCSYLCLFPLCVVASIVEVWFSNFVEPQNLGNK